MYVMVITLFQIFGDGSVAQYVLSKGELGSAHSIHWSWGVGVMMGVYASGGVSGKFMSKLTFWKSNIKVL